MIGKTARQRTARRARVLVTVLLAGAAGALLGGPPAGAAATCVWDPDSQDVAITIVGPDTITIARTAGGLLHVTGGGIADPDCDPGGSRSTMNHIGTINVATVEPTPSNQTVVLDLGNGPFALGNELESTDSSPEIEFTIDLGTGTDTLEVLGEPGADHFTAGADGVNLNSNEVVEPDVDLVPANIETIKLNGQGGNDVISGQGGAGTGAARSQSQGGITFVGGLGDDTLTGGDGDDVFDEGSAASGADTIVGGQGTDEVTYATRPASDPVSVSADGLANDGSVSSNEKDNVDVENLTGGEGDDTLSGSPANNTFRGGDGTDGTDTVSYAGRTEGFAITLATTSTVGAANRSGGGESDVIHASIENVVGSEGIDTITGNDSANKLDGGPGNDTISGGGDNDVLIGGDGDDTLTGGTGVAGDTADYSSASTGVEVDLSVTTAQNTIGAGIDTLTQIEHLTGSPEDDILKGDANANTLKGGDGDDVLVGKEGNDTQNGEGGFDTLTFADRPGPITVTFTGSGAGNTGGDSSTATSDTFSSIELVVGSPANDTFNSGSANDNFDAGGGDDDLVSYSSLTTAGVSVNVDLATGTATGHGSDTFLNVENATGGGGNDTLLGSEADNDLVGGGGNDRLDGRGGNDSLSGGGGDDTLTGGPGDDTLNGGDTSGTTTTPGSDTADYSTATVRVRVTLDVTPSTQTTEFTQDTLGAGIDKLTKIENLTGGSGDDILTGDGAVNRIDGGDGDDTLTGRPGDDILIGGAGDDRMSAAGGDDTADFSGAPLSGVQVNLSALPEQTAEGHGSDKMSGIVHVVGSAGNDVIVGDARANTLFGGAGHDTLKGDDGDDTLEGGAGNDTLHGGAGNDVLNGEDGNGDTADYSSLTTPVHANLVTNSATGQGTDTLTFIENLTGGSGADTLTGNGSANVLTGGPGGDTLDGAGGNDTASYANASSGLTADLATTTNNTGDAQGDIYGPTSTASATIENLTGSGGSDSLRGDGTNNVLNGLAGDDTLVGRGGDDTLAGGDGVADHVDYSGNTAVTVDLAGPAPQATGVGNDTITGVENVTGSTADDTIGGNDSDNELVGGGGTDTVTFASSGTEVDVDLQAGTATGAGSDTLTGFENVIGSPQDDILGGDSGNNVISGGGGSDTVTYENVSGTGVTVDLRTTAAQTTGAGDDTLSEIENLTGSPQGDILAGDSGDNVIDGGNGVDTLTFAAATAFVDVDLADGIAEGDGDDVIFDIENLVGSPQGDTLNGDDGDNVIDGGDGDDTINGRGGDDTEVGGNGDDSFYQDTARNGADDMSGGAGADRVTYDDRPTIAFVSFDNQPNDGEVGEGDNARSDIESAELSTFVPTAPTNVQATAGDGLATVAWTAPANDGGSPITGYDVLSNPGNKKASTGPEARSATVTGLTNGVTYTFTVTATNSAGTGTASAPSNAVTPVKPPPPPVDPTAGQGYAMLGNDGGVFNYGAAGNYGSIPGLGLKLNQPPIGMSYTPTGKGYWIVAQDGGIFTFGDAKFHGSMGGAGLNAPVLGMEPTPTGGGYWLFASDGGIFSFGDAKFFGSMGASKLNAAVIGMAATSTGKGYWLVAQDGGIFSFGDAKFRGSMGSAKLNQPVFDMAPAGDDAGYYLVARDGGIFAFGSAAGKFFGSAAPSNPATVIGIGTTPSGNGYWIADRNGVVYAFGDAKALGDLRSQGRTVVGLAALPKQK